MSVDSRVDRPRRARHVALLLAVLGGVFAVSILVLHRFGPEAQQLSDCPRVTDTGLRETCLRSALTQLVATAGPAATAASLGDFLAQEPASSDLRRLCHVAAHDAGQSRRTNQAQLTAFLASRDAGVCEWGLAHGLLSALLTTDPAPTDLTALLTTCSTLREIATRLGCADSVGHMVWELEGEFGRAVDQCFSVSAPATSTTATSTTATSTTATSSTAAATAASPDGASAPAHSVSEACLGGVFMQFYRPVAPSSERGQWSAPIDDAGIVDLCRSLPPAREPACAEAAHYAFSDELRRLRDAVLADGAAASEFPSLLTDALEFCGRFSGPGAARCTDASARYFLQATQGLPDLDPVALICAPLAPAPRDRCTATAVSLRLVP